MADADALIESGRPGAPSSQDPASPTPAASGDPSVMTLFDHLGELRTRLFRSVLAVVAGSVVGFIAAPSIRAFLVMPLPPDQRVLQVLGPGDAFMIQLRISIITGIILAMPVLLYQVWSFVSPGLTPTERRAVRPWIPLALFFFVLGVGIAFVVLPYATEFLLGFTDATLVANLTATAYFDFVTTMFLAFGLVMEFPILLVGLSRVGIVTSERMRGSRRFVILGIAIFAATVTPGGDLVSPFVLGGTMYLLFEGTLLFIRRSGR
ncbi:MAG: twin-arginine translocase subunit TatC [Candidatus Limnocylindria bacterium]